MQSLPNFFGPNSPFLNHPLLTPERTAAEVTFVIETLGLSPGMRVLDVGCGFGRHALELARKGYDVVGIDPSPAMIAAAEQRAGGLFPEKQLSFRCEQGEGFSAERSFDAAIALFTILGQISESGSNEGLVDTVYEALVPDGRFLVEVPQRSVAVANLKTAERFGEGDVYTDVSRQYDSHSHVWSETFEVVNGDSTKNFLLQYRLYSWPELQALLERAGFKVLVAYGGYDGRPRSDDSPIMLVSAVK
ncbi:MAG: class I SAM-dependent methyltransferase [Candidatus Promineifilaceae bacterium]